MLRCFEREERPAPLAGALGMYGRPGGSGTNDAPSHRKPRPADWHVLARRQGANEGRDIREVLEAVDELEHLVDRRLGEDE